MPDTPEEREERRQLAERVEQIRDARSPTMTARESAAKGLEFDHQPNRGGSPTMPDTPDYDPLIRWSQPYGGSDPRAKGSPTMPDTLTPTALAVREYMDNHPEDWTYQGIADAAIDTLTEAVREALNAPKVANPPTDYDRGVDAAYHHVLAILGEPSPTQPIVVATGNTSTIIFEEPR